MGAPGLSHAAPDAALLPLPPPTLLQGLPSCRASPTPPLLCACLPASAPPPPEYLSTKPCTSSNVSFLSFVKSIALRIRWYAIAILLRLPSLSLALARIPPHSAALPHLAPPFFACLRLRPPSPAYACRLRYGRTPDDAEASERGAVDVTPKASNVRTHVKCART